MAPRLVRTLGVVLAPLGILLLLLSLWITTQSDPVGDAHSPTVPSALTISSPTSTVDEEFLQQLGDRGGATLNVDSILADLKQGFSNVHSISRDVLSAGIEGAIGGDAVPKARGAPPEAEGKGGKEEKVKFLFHRPRCCSGVNNQLEEFWWALQLAIHLKRGLVLPMIAEKVTWFHPQMDHMVPYHWMFDPDVLSQIVPTIPFLDWRDMCNSTVEVDIYPEAPAGKRNKRMQEGYEKYLKISSKSARKVHVKHWRELEAQDLPDCLGVQWPLYILGKEMDFAAPSQVPIGGRLETNKAFALLRSHTTPAREIHTAVSNFTRGLGRYLAAHFRVGDFDSWCKQSYDVRKCPSFKIMSGQLGLVAAHYGLKRVFLACDPDYIKEVLSKLKADHPGLTFSTFTPEGEIYTAHPDVLGMAEQQICTDSEVFVGNTWSTWSRSVHELRWTNGKPCEKTLQWATPWAWCIPTKKAEFLEEGLKPLLASAKRK